MATDPLALVHAAEPGEREVVAHVAAALAYGQVAQIKLAIVRVLEAFPEGVTEALRQWQPGEFLRRQPSFVYRMTRGEDVDAYLTALSVLMRRHGSLGAAFSSMDDGGADVLPALERYNGSLREAMGSERRGALYLVPLPSRGSATKRSLLLLRWLVRGPDGADLGLWSSVGPARLVIPVDTHVGQLSRALGLTSRRAVDLTTAVEITESLRRIDAGDPLRFDMPLCHLGISGACRKRWDAAVCGTCPLEGVCVWTAVRGRVEARG